MIPLRDANPTRRPPVITLALIIACTAVFAYELGVQATGGEEGLSRFFLEHGVVPAQLSAALRAGEVASDQVLGLLTHMFLHGGWLHLFGNMLYLWIFGNNVEDRLGRITFVGFYVLGGLAATALQVAFDPNSAVPNVGASGAIAAILGSYLVMFPRARIHTLVIFVFITFLDLPATVVLVGWFVLQLFSGAGEMGRELGSGGIAYWAHVGGFAFGLAVTWLFFRSRGRRDPYALPPPPPYPY